MNYFFWCFFQQIDGEAFLLLTQNDMVNILKLKLGPALKIFNTIPKHWCCVGRRRSSITTDISSRAGSIQLTFLSVSYKCSCCFLGVVNQWLRLKLHLKKPVLSSCTFRQNSFNLNPSKFSREKISSAKFLNLSPVNIVPLTQRLEKCKKFVSHYSQKLM